MVCPFVVARIRAEVEDKVPAPQSRLLWHSAPLSNTRAQHQHVHVHQKLRSRLGQHVTVMF